MLQNRSPRRTIYVRHLIYRNGIAIPFPAKYLIKAGKSLKAAVETEDKEKVEEGIRNTKGFYKFNSILIIASFALTVIVVIGASIDSISAAM